MHFTPKKTLELIVNNHQGYIVPLKGNQKKLRERLLESVNTRKPQSSHSYQQKAQGRHISYRVKVWSVDALEEWVGLRSLILVRRQGSRGKKQFKTESYYISTEQASAYQFGKWIQGHRRIENNLHWVKDVILGEDSCALSKTNSALVMGILRSIGLNLLRFAGVSSVTAGIMEMRTKVGILVSDYTPLSKEFV